MNRDPFIAMHSHKIFQLDTPNLKLKNYTSNHGDLNVYFQWFCILFSFAVAWQQPVDHGHLELSLSCPHYKFYWVN